MFPAQLSDIVSGVFMLQSSGNMFAHSEFIPDKTNNKAAPCKDNCFVVLQDKI